MKSRVLIVIIISLLGCVSCQKSLRNIISHAEDASFIIYTYDEFGSPHGTGSGFFIDSKGTGITNYHVLDGASKAFIKTSDEKEYEIESVIGSDKNWDLIKFTLKGNRSSFKYLKFANKPVKKGDEVYNISSPLGLEKTASSGIVSSFRTDKKHGEVVQVTTPISSGSSGSPLFNKNGDVFAVATFYKDGGQNLNFGVLVNQESISNLTKSDFEGDNNKINTNSNFIILNIPAEKGPDIVLNAIEFDDNATTLYLSFTHLLLSGGDDYFVWVELGGNEDDFTILDLESNKEYYVTSSSVGVNKENATKVSLVTTTKFKVFLPPIKDTIERFSVYGCGKNDSRWVFKDIDLNKYKETVNVNFENYKRDHAFAYLRDGEYGYANELLIELIDNNPDDALALNALGIMSYLSDNNRDALYYFTEAINKNPNYDLSYLNRHEVYKYQGNYSKALNDITKAINIEPNQPDNFVYRASLYMDMENWAEAKNDINKVIESKDFNKDPSAYLIRIFANIFLGNFDEACLDISTAISLIDNSDIESKERLQDLSKRYGCQ